MTLMSRLSLVLLAALLAGAPARAAEVDTPGTVEVAGTGGVAAVPDRAAFTTAVTAEAASAANAVRTASERARSVLAALAKMGVAEKDIQTGGVNLSPVYARPPADRGGAARVSGYRASLSQTVRVVDLGTLGALMDAATQAGANGLGGLHFFVADDAPLRDAARARAVADARRAAEVLATAAGAGLGRVLSIREETVGAAPRPMMAMRAEAASAVPVAPGEITVEVRVRVVYQLAAN